MVKSWTYFKKGSGKGKPQDSDSGEGEMQNNHPPKPTDIDDLMDSDSIDEHDYEAAQDIDDKKLEEDIDRVLRQGAILAGVLGGNANRAIDNLLEVKVDWREVLRDFISSYTVGKSEYTWLYRDWETDRKSVV